MAKPAVAQFLVGEEGTLIDHSPWKGLNIARHSMRIGVVAQRCKHGMEMIEIMRLGHRQDSTINCYPHPKLCLPPEKLKKRHYKTHRTEEWYLVCSCPKKLSTQFVKTKRQQAHNQQLRNSRGTTNQVRVQIRRKQRQLDKLVRVRKTLPSDVKMVKKIVAGNAMAKPMVINDTLDNTLIKENFKGQHSWFDISVYIALYRCQHFQQMCKYMGTQ